jgi:hypothetical protein
LRVRDASCVGVRVSQGWSLTCLNVVTLLIELHLATDKKSRWGCFWG